MFAIQIIPQVFASTVLYFSTAYRHCSMVQIKIYCIKIYCIILYYEMIFMIYIVYSGEIHMKI